MSRNGGGDAEIMELNQQVNTSEQTNQQNAVYKPFTKSVCSPAAAGSEIDGQRFGERERFLLQQTQRH